MSPFAKKFVSVVVVIFVAAFAAAAQGEKPGAELYKKSCAMCHGADGSGNSPMGQKMGVRDLKSAEVQNQTDAQLTQIIDKGKGKMPAYGQKLKPGQVKELIAYIRSLKK